MFRLTGVQLARLRPGYFVSVKSTGAGMGTEAPSFTVGAPADDEITINRAGGDRFRNAADDLQRKGQHLERLKLERLAETIRRGFLRGSAQRGNISNGAGRAMGLSAREL